MVRAKFYSRLNRTRDNLSPESDNYCPEIYRGMFIDRFNDTHVRVAPCCQARTETESLEQFSFYHSDYLNRMRKAFDAGIKPEACNLCWRAEDSGHKSRRLSMIEFHQAQSQPREVRLESLDCAITWACNLACVMCNESSSSTWARELDLDREQLQVLGRAYQRRNPVLDRLDLSGLKRLHFNGGEPFINNEQIMLLDRLRADDILQKIQVSYNTNATISPSPQLIDLWQSAQLVKIIFSIDAIQDAFEYIRWPAQWNQVSTNMLQMRDTLPSNVMFGFNVTVGCYNIFEINQVSEWFDTHLSTNREGDRSDFNWQIADNFNPTALTISAKSNAVQQLKNIDRLKSLCNYIESVMHMDPCDDWLTLLDKIDHRRGTNWRKSLKVSSFY